MDEPEINWSAPSFPDLALVMLVGVKILHTAVWLFFVACIVGVPIAGELRRFRLAGLFAILVLLECAVLAVNHFRCPLTDIAAQYSTDRTTNFDIYLPLWLARWNQAIFGSLFAVGGIFALPRRLQSRQ